MEGICLILSNISKATAFIHQGLTPDESFPLNHVNNLIKKGSAFRNIGYINKYSFHCLINLASSHLHFKITADQILHQDPVLVFFYVWSLLTYVILAE